MPTLLLIGYGNPLRRDDGAGPLLAERLAAELRARGAAVRLLQVQQLLPELAAELVEPGVAAVLFADARPAAGPGDRELEVAPVALGAGPSPSLGHQASPALVLAYTEAFAASPPPAWLLTVPAHDLGFGEGLSAATEAAIATALADPGNALGRLLARLTGAGGQSPVPPGDAGPAA